MFYWNEAAGMAFLLNLAVKSSALLAAAWLAAFALRRQSAAARHMVWMAAFAALLALPVLSIAIPALELPAPAWLPNASSLIFHANATSDGAAPSDALSGAPFPAAASTRHAPAGLNLDWPLWAMLIWGVGSAALLAQMIAAYM